MDDLNTCKIAKKNIKNRKGRAYGIIMLTAVLSFALFVSSFLMASLQNGLESLEGRMGADLIIVPEGYDAKITDAILRGEPNTFFLDESVMEEIFKLDGVEKVSPQFFLATLTAGCCSFPIQIIGIDMDRDFTVAPWLESEIKAPLGDREIVVGSNVRGDYHEQVKFFNQAFTIKGRLGKTGTGFDNSVFMTIDDAKKLAKEYERVLENPEASVEGKISSVMIKLKPGVAAETVRDEVLETFRGQGVYPILTKSFMSEVASGIRALTPYILILMILLWVLSFLVLVLLAVVSMKERRREIAMFKIIGATEKQIRRIFLMENLFLGLYGALPGTFVGIVISMLFGTWMAQTTKLPFLIPKWQELFLIAAFALAIGLFSSPLSALGSLRKMEKTDAALLLRENE